VKSLAEALLDGLGRLGYNRMTYCVVNHTKEHLLWNLRPSAIP
jgi:hypothetical protein